METMRVQDVTPNDLPWKIRYDASRCTLCGSCVSACSFRAIEAKVERRRMVFSESELPEPKARFSAVPVIRQVKSVKNYCRGCGICEKVCPNDAIRPERNPDTRHPIVTRCLGGDSIKRGGRKNLESTVRTLDKIRVGRISQMTDPSLDAQRHTFDLLAPFGRILPPQKLPLGVGPEGLLRTEGSTPPVRWIYPVVIGDMSIGALSWRMWEAVAMATAYLNEECGLPVRMCSGEGGVPVRLLKSRYLKYMILQIASGHFGWNRIAKAMPHMIEDPAGVLIKIGQGAKPGDGGLLMAQKVAEHIQAIRGVPKADLLSPPNHQGLYSIEESVQKMFLSFNAAFKFRVPVAIKVAASSTSVSVFNNLVRDPYNIVGGFFLDGIDGGTGAAHEVSLDHTGHPIVSKLRDCYLAAVAQGRQGQIPLWAAGGLGKTGDLAADAFKMIALGANGVFSGKLILQMAGCVGNDQGRCNACNTGLCPVGITTQEPPLVHRLDPERVAQNIVNYFLAMDTELKKLMAPIGNSSLPVGRSDALVATDRAVADKLQIQYVC
ncbi:4Fe-4S dicluster domain-containing protein [Geothermobacter hydrogeniphilus]|uniref:glutamate synthase (NADPH) n=1 Tax=Geothermobacter hydrogeniphilus TaxID=1969733 RepID=A0A1X0Y0U5_9BACT|nr:glutamate synthase-related protein [Geothermobacter hydrogeniphilus]ORJ58692.1 glutamate synthase [Geothermobacter hydrogeniphilus]PNU18972.1 4Fe-4S dicluster domain-containing protein [Geothermobacter hydrogeniphilus]